jgi:hypothetical protein
MSISRKGRWPSLSIPILNRMFSWTLVQVVKEVDQLAWTMWPDNAHNIHIMKSIEGLVGHPIQSHLFKIITH